MKRFAISVVISICLGLALFPLAQAVQAKGGAKLRLERKGPLDRTEWWVEMSARGQQPMADVLMFKHEEFDSIACRAYGFGGASYKSAKEGNAVTFTATTKSRTEGTMQWKGKAKGDSISGTMAWKRKSGSPMEMTFSGTRHAAKGMLDATDWKVDLTAAGQRPMADTLLLKRGAFDSKACHKYGFGAGPYMAKKEGKAMDFTAFTTSDSQGMMEWTGKVEGDKVSGKMIWYPPKGEAKKFTFGGTETKGKTTHDRL